MNQQSPSSPSPRTRIRRLAEKASYEQQTLYAVIDEAYLCNIAFNDGTSTHCIPTACWRIGNALYVHGSNGGRLTKILTAGTQVSVAITHLDGLVLARSAFNHSMHYRSAVIYGTFELVEDKQAKIAAMDALMDKIAAGRKHEARPGNAKELAATSVMRISLDEAACKISNSAPSDDEEDMQLPVWAGVLPLAVKHGEPMHADNGSIPTPAYVTGWVKTA
ncbi:pyridoxamine 5'-phosphate oxidase family protein [Cellvibrio fibrivorans]|uniref:Nitroimidazol reductase NimA-like FMN-containing flavoprotein (Pyridoxamine 5'-phosphate oxidase superfamily) n=1 Tax=Cellvibrio fibrivorans TaxID=126350 RepID=A0ABU1V082_9GAMM|nr:pyridoxamine 5'-phosphate oxidase family protein [Cellvibrio fibrivorans]MDR7090844.1 nitroimidazol reductase NimA-like FMN-containing flavoprotein (pyridoxamine 5'-phosphate oxidase superfamily) [Cellvibrio fibrivorans]